MAPKNKPYEQFGPYVLFRKLEKDSLSELWRAARIDGNQLGALVALRRFTGGNLDAIAASAESAHDIAPLLTGTSFARNQVIGVINRTPFIAHDYSGGRSLRHIVEKARGGAGVQPNPIPMDQVVLIAEKIALSLATTADLRFGTTRLTHGALLPSFVWISDDGEIRVAGQQLAQGLIASLKDARVAAEYGRYFAPESHATGMQSKGADVYATGAILYLLTTGVEPPDAVTASAFTQSVRAAKAMTGGPVPDEVRAILDRSLNLDVTARYASIADMKQAISAVAHGGKYSATTFNLAFYLSNLLKKELEGETIEREKEVKVNVAPYLEALAPAAPEVAHSAPSFASLETPAKRSRMPLAIAAVVALAAIGAGALYMFRTQAAVRKAVPSSATAAVSTITPPKPAIVPQPLVAASPTGATAAPATVTSSTGLDDAARKKAFEAAVEQKLQEEMMKLQADYTKQLKQQQSKHAPVQVATTSSSPAAAVASARPPAAAEEGAPSAAQLDQQRLAARQEPAQTQTAPATVAQTQPAPAQQTATAAPPPAPAAPVVHEGDVVEVSELDTAPRFLRRAAPRYPVMAARQRVETIILLTALVSENGDVLEVKVLRGDPRFGFQDEAIRAAKSTKFTSPMKDGKRVKTWFPIPVHFSL